MRWVSCMLRRGICLWFRGVSDGLLRRRRGRREKVAICFVAFLASSFFVGIFGFIPAFLCQEKSVYMHTNMVEHTSKDCVIVCGYAYHVDELFDRQINASRGIQLQASLGAFLHDDASCMFPCIPKTLLLDM